MTKNRKYIFCLALLVSLFIVGGSGYVTAQTDSVNISGTVFESGTGNALNMVSVSDAVSGISTSTDEKGEFSIRVGDDNTMLIFNLPGYTKRSLYVHGKTTIRVYLVPEMYKSEDKLVITPLENKQLKDVVTPLEALTVQDLEMTTITSFDQGLQGKISGLYVQQQSGMPGQRTYMNIRGGSSLLASNEPVVFIDGMLHNYNYAKNGILEGFTLNPMDIIDDEDITDITVMKDGLSFLGSAGSNGLINISSEQEAEASTRIKFSAYGGMASSPQPLEVLNADQFRTYFDQVLSGQGYSTDQINNMYPWLNGNQSASGYYKYNNRTDWQKEIFKPAVLQKYHFFLKGGDEIATYNISTGYIAQDGIYDNTGYNRFNLRINGKINITNHFSVKPNVKISLANSTTPNQGYSHFKNPMLSALLKPSIMQTNARDALTGAVLPYLDDVGDIFPVSNPVAITRNALGKNVNYIFVSSLKATYEFSDKLSVSTLVGIDYNNSHEDIFLPDIGLAQVDSAKNSPQYFINEFQSVQSHTMATYHNVNSNGHAYTANAGLRYMKNNYKYNYAIDLNTASDEISSLGKGGKYTYLREVGGDETGLVWLSYFANLGYNFKQKYFIEAGLSYDGSSALSGDQRFNLYPSVAAAWRPVDNFKLRGSYSATGNMFSSVYYNSQNYYVTRRLNSTGVLLREAIPNPDMEIERKNTVNVGTDLTFFGQQLNLHIDAYQSNINNLLMQQELPFYYGYPEYYNNDGQLKISGLDVSLDTRLNLGPVIWTLAVNASKTVSEITALSFIDPEADKIVTDFYGGQMVTSVGNSRTAFYGYETNGIFNTDAEAAAVTGPNGEIMQAGDIKYHDADNNNIINEADKTVIGDPNPDFYGGVFTAFKLNRLQLSAQLNYAVGNDAFNYVKYLTESMYGYSNQSVSVLNRWTGPGTSNSVPRSSIGDPTGNTVFSDRWIEDASFVRLKQLTISYDFPKAFGFRGLTAYVTATNLLTFTSYSGYDPEFQYTNDAFGMGLDYGQMPQTRKFMVGLKLDL
ncbi:SusC/RagA family TonB-linked outer membrane protein [Saccharicrinis sp. FJH54]|uniref:SusC/RagA family TonB-linked outer membrane protein n=1 Tax=Saccharicrinis sp. FJH54 TaxID=3344665 RepID=UPI0035D458AA